MVLNGDGKVKTEIKLNGEVLKEVEKFKYLGSWITTNGGHMTDIKCRIAETKIAFADMKNILANLKMPFDLRYRILNCYVMPILLYGCENWILNQQQINRLEATEIWFIRRMQKISWKEKKTNEIINEMLCRLCKVESCLITKAITVTKQLFRFREQLLGTDYSETPLSDEGSQVHDGFGSATA